MTTPTPEAVTLEAALDWIREVLPVLREDRQCLIDSHCLLTPQLEPRIETLDDDVRPEVESLEAKIVVAERLLEAYVRANAGERGGWLPIEVEPEADGFYLAWCALTPAQSHHLQVVKFKRLGGWFTSWGPTHWQPLPPAPTLLAGAAAAGRGGG